MTDFNPLRTRVNLTGALSDAASQDDTACTGVGVATITLLFRRDDDGATIAHVNLP